MSCKESYSQHQTKLLEQVLWWAKNRLNAEVEEREDEREEKWAIS